MKSEHRHELETNELSAKLAKSIEGLKPISGQILVGIGLLLGLYAALSIWNAQVETKEREAWEAYAMATDSDDPGMDSLQKVAASEEFAGTKMSEWAYVGWADRQVLNAIRYYFVDREQTQDLLKSVQGIYQQFSTDADDPQVLNRARFGLARVYELQGKLDEARQQYLTVRGNLETQASERAKHIESDAAKEACSWLAMAELPKRDLTGGMGATGARPDFRSTLPAASPSGDSITEKSLEELLGDLEGATAGENRYGEKDEVFKTDGTGDAPAEDDGPAEDQAPAESEESTDTDGNESDAPAE